MLKRFTTAALVGLGALAFASACSDFTNTQPGHRSPSFAKGGNGGGGQPSSGIPVSVNLPSPGSADITGDGSPYVDGDAGVTASITTSSGDLDFDLDAPKHGTAREICFNFSNGVQVAAGVADPPTGEICSQPIWNTRDVDLPSLVPGQATEGASRYIFSPESGVQYKVRFGDEPACDGLVDPVVTGVVITGGADADGDTMSDSWTVDATGRVAYVTKAVKTTGKPEASGFKCVGTYGMAWVATLTKQ